MGYDIKISFPRPPQWRHRSPGTKSVKAWRKSLTRAKRASLVLSLVPDLSFDCSRLLEYAKIRSILQSSLGSKRVQQAIFSARNNNNNINKNNSNNPVPEAQVNTMNEEACPQVNTRARANSQKTWGPFLESLGNFSGPKSYIQIEIQRIRARVLAGKLLHFDSLTDSFIMLDAKLLKPRSLIQTETAYRAR